ncbi:hypothetical protein STENM327S_03571 [Streptomyces tendae]
MAPICHRGRGLADNRLMANEKLGESLRVLGLDPTACRVYLALLELSPAPLEAIGAATGLSGDRLTAAYAALADTGLASAAAGDGDVVAPVPPAAGLEVLARHRAAELEESRIAVGGAFESFRRRRLAAYNDGLVEVVTGEDVGPRMRQAWTSAREQIRQFESPPYVHLAGATDDALATLARGVTQRVVYAREALERPGQLEDVIEPCIEAGEQLGEVAVPLGGLVGRAGDDQRRTGLVDEDGVDLVDDGEVVAALDELVLGPRHVVAQVVETELVVRAVGDVAGVHLAALGRRLVGEDAADVQTQELVDAAHHLGVALGQVVLDRDDVHALAGQGVEIGGQRADEGLALTGLHLGHVAHVQGGAAHDLHVVVALAQDTLGGLTDGGEGFGQQVVQALTVGVALLVLVGEGPQLGVGEVSEVLFDGVDLVRDAVQLAQDLAFLHA